MRTAGRSGTGREDSDRMLPIFALVGALVLLILSVACANLGSLLLARGVARQREISIRISVGAGTFRLIRQLFTESLILALLGSGCGLFFGYVILRGLMTLTRSPAWLDPMPDWRVVAFAVGVGIASAILFGLAPAWQIARQRHRATIVRQLLVGAQVAASCVLLIVAGLLSRALNHAVTSSPGFEYQQVISIDPGLSRHGRTPAASRAYLNALQSRLEALPGVASVSLALVPPLGRVSIEAGATVDGHEVAIQINRVDPRFLETMKIPMLRGRNLMPGDAHEIVVSDSLARTAWPGQDPLGKRLDLGPGWTVVGVAGNARTVKLEDSGGHEAYMPIEPGDYPVLNMLVRTTGRPEDLAHTIGSTARSLDRDIYPEVQLVRTGFQKKLEGAEYSALAVSVLGAIAHLLACLGIVGVIAYSVSQRTKEIGLRMALGATPGNVLAVVLRQFARPVVAGMLAGLAAAIGISGLLRGVLFGVSHLDPITYLGTMAVFFLTVVVAAVLPARRALRVDPLLALRHE